MTMKTNGMRNRGRAMFRWAKTAYYFDPLEPEELDYLSELAQIRNRLVDGKVRSEEKLDRLYARQDEIVGILGDFHCVDVTFPNNDK